MSNKLEKKYGLLTAICMVVGIVVGSGVFFKAQTILEKTEGDMPLGIIAWIIGGVIMIFCILAFSSRKSNTSVNVTFLFSTAHPPYTILFYSLTSFLLNSNGLI